MLNKSASTGQHQPVTATEPATSTTTAGTTTCTPLGVRVPGHAVSEPKPESKPLAGRAVQQLGRDFYETLLSKIESSLETSKTAWTPQEVGNRMTEVVNGLREFAQSRRADVDLRARALAKCLETLEHDRMHFHGDRQTWMDAVAAFSLECYTEAERGDEPWSGVSHPEWLDEKRTAMCEALPDAGAVNLQQAGSLRLHISDQVPGSL